MDITPLRKKLSSIGQEPVLRFHSSLDLGARKRLVGQLQALDLDNIAELSKKYVKHKPAIVLPKDIQPGKAYPRVPDAAQREFYEQARKRGRELLAEGKIAAFLVAGGQGTRLGYDGPKGEYPITPVKNKSLFQVFAEQLRAHSLRCGQRDSLVHHDQRHQ